MKVKRHELFSILVASLVARRSDGSPYVDKDFVCNVMLSLAAGDLVIDKQGIKKNRKTKKKD